MIEKVLSIETGDKDIIYWKMKYKGKFSRTLWFIVKVNIKMYKS